MRCSESGITIYNRDYTVNFYIRSKPSLSEATASLEVCPPREAACKRRVRVDKPNGNVPCFPELENNALREKAVDGRGQGRAGLGRNFIRLQSILSHALFVILAPWPLHLWRTGRTSLGERQLLVAAALEKGECLKSLLGQHPDEVVRGTARRSEKLMRRERDIDGGRSWSCSASSSCRLVCDRSIRLSASRRGNRDSSRHSNGSPGL